MVFSPSLSDCDSDFSWLSDCGSLGTTSSSLLGFTVLFLSVWLDLGFVIGTCIWLLYKTWYVGRLWLTTFKIALQIIYMSLFDLCFWLARAFDKVVTPILVLIDDFEWTVIAWGKTFGYAFLSYGWHTSTKSPISENVDVLKLFIRIDGFLADFWTLDDLIFKDWISCKLESVWIHYTSR